MPIYEYICNCGATFDRVMPMDKRHNVVCACGTKAKIRIGNVSYRVAQPFRVYAHDGTLLHETQTIEKTPPPMYRYENPNLAEV